MLSEMNVIDIDGKVVNSVAEHTQPVTFDE